MPVLKSHRLCDKNDKYSTKAKALKFLRDEFMLTVNAAQPNHMGEDMRLAVFWQAFPGRCKEVRFDGRPPMKPSTVRGYAFGCIQIES
jgi:hypothetical protein